MEFREALIDHEKEIAKFYPTLPRAKSTNKRISFYTNLKHDGDLMNYLNISLAENPEILPDSGSNLTYPSLLQIIDEWANRLNLDDKLDIHKLAVGTKYSHEEVCALTGKFNFMQGMSLREINGEPVYAVVHATLTQDSHIRNDNYNDHWIEYPTLMHYSMQNETKENIAHHSFSFSPNRKIFDSIIDHSNFPIYLFVRDKAGELFDFMGEYVALKVDDDDISFVLGKRDYDDAVENEITEQKYVYQYCNENARDVVKGKELVSCRIPKADEAKAKNFIQSSKKVDYIRQAMINQRVGELGELLVIEYEKKRLNGLGIPADLSAKIRKEPDDSKGFDIHSFDLVNGKFIEIKIEVKTTTGEAKTTFFMSNNEYLTMKSPENKGIYWIYRVFNIHSVKPGFYAVTKDFNKIIKINPDTWRCDLIA